MGTLLSLAGHVPGVRAQIPDRGFVFGELERKDVALSDDAANPFVVAPSVNATRSAQSEYAVSSFMSTR